MSAFQTSSLSETLDLNGFKSNNGELLYCHSFNRVNNPCDQWKFKSFFTDNPFLFQEIAIVEDLPDPYLNHGVKLNVHNALTIIPSHYKRIKIENGPITNDIVLLKGALGFRFSLWLNPTHILQTCYDIYMENKKAFSAVPNVENFLELLCMDCN